MRSNTSDIIWEYERALIAANWQGYGQAGRTNAYNHLDYLFERRREAAKLYLQETDEKRQRTYWLIIDDINQDIRKYIGV